MLDIKTARCIKEAINNEIGISIAVEDVCKMQPITITSSTQLPSEFNIFPTILGIQWGTHTILVWVEFPNDSEIMVREVQMLDW